MTAATEASDESMPSVKVVGPYAGNLAYSRHSANRSQMTDARSGWTKDEARALHDLPLTDLLFRAQEVHRATQPRDAVQLCSLLSIKTGACQEDCGYCPQSSKYDTGVEAERLMDVEDVLEKARQAKEAPPSVRVVQPDLPEHVDRAIQCALAKRPRKRCRRQPRH